MRVERAAASRIWSGRSLIGGVVAGEVVRCTAPISGWGGIDPSTGTIVERRHPQRGLCFADKVLVVPGAKGSSGWSGQFHLALLSGTAPAAIVATRLNSKLALGLVVLGVPALTDLTDDPVLVLADGDRVTVDAERGMLTLHTPKGS